MQLFDAVSRLDAKHNPAWLNLGLVHARIYNEAAALKSFRLVLNEADAYNTLGYIYMMDKSPSRLISALKKRFHCRRIITLWPTKT
jgi:hypothetical protein